MGDVESSLLEACTQYFSSTDLKSGATRMASPREAGRDGGTPSLPSRLCPDDRGQLRWLRSPEERASCVARLQTLQRRSASSSRGALSTPWPDGSGGGVRLPCRRVSRAD